MATACSCKCARLPTAMPCPSCSVARSRASRAPSSLATVAPSASTMRRYWPRPRSMPCGVGEACVCDRVSSVASDLRYVHLAHLANGAALAVVAVQLEQAHALRTLLHAVVAHHFARRVLASIVHHNDLPRECPACRIRRPCVRVTPTAASCGMQACSTCCPRSAASSTSASRQAWLAAAPPRCRQARPASSTATRRRTDAGTAWYCRPPALMVSQLREGTARERGSRHSTPT